MGKLTKRLGRRAISALLFVALFAAALPQHGVALAADFTIGCTGGVGDTAALISAITRANSNRQDDLIQLAAGCTYTLAAPHNTTGGPNGLPLVGADGGRSLVIAGNGATIRRADAARPFRLLYLDGGKLTLRELTLAGGLAVGGSGEDRTPGRVGGFGGAVYNAGQLTLEGVTITASEARGGDGASRTASSSGGGGGGGAGLGGALFNASSARLTLINSTLSGNTSRGGNGGSGGNNGTSYPGGGGGGNGGAGGASPASATQPGRPGAAATGLGGGGGGGGGSNGNARSSFAPGNPRAGVGGAGAFGGGGGGAGASRLGGSGNLGGAAGAFGGAGGDACCSYAGGGGGGGGLGAAIFNNGGTVTISFSTIFNNSGVGGAGGLGSFGFGDGKPGSGGAAVFSRGGSVSYGGAILAGNGADCATAEGGALSSLGSNLLATEGGCASASSDRRAAELGVLPLANNGGPTFTHALAPTSPAVDAAGSSCAVATDQRRTLRPQGPACDSGAFELVPARVELIVTTTADAGPGSLRAAILGANSQAGPDTIRFAIAGGTPTIILTTALPPLTGPTTIDGLSQLGEGRSGPVTLDGSQLPGADGLALTGASTVMGLVITGFGGAGIAITGNGNTVAGTTLTRNGGAGVRIASGIANNLGGNSIFRNGGLAIDLGGDGATPNDPGDPDSGANTLLNAPGVSALEGPAGITLSGSLDAPAGTYRVELYASQQCALRASGEGASFQIGGPGEGQELIGTATVTVAAGPAAFSLAAAVSLERATQWFSGIAIDAAGNTSEFSACAPVQTNDLWTNARDLSFTTSGAVRTATQSQSITRDYQERWYRFPVAPESRVTITLNGQPGSGMTLHRDLQQVYDDLALPKSPADSAVQELPAGFLPAGFLPAGFLPAGFLPAGFLPAGFLPAGFLPAGFLPAGFLPAGFLPAGFLPAGFLPAGFLPAGFLPGSSLPAGFLPAGFLPAGFLPAGFLPELYSGAVRDSLMAFAFDPEGTVLTIDRNSWDLAENLYIRVTGPVSATPFTLEVRVEGGICANVTAPTGSTVVNGGVPAGSLSRLFVWDANRFAASDPAGNVFGAGGLQGRLDAFATGLNGTVIDLGDAVRYPRVAAARATATANPSCVVASNLLAAEIKAVIDAYRTANSAGGQTTLQDITLIGGNEVVPFELYPDLSGLAVENEYFPPVAEFSPSNAALREARVKGQDGYGSRVSVWQGSYARPIPDLPVGRLVGDTASVNTMLTAYETANGLVAPTTALVTGYDFVADAAETVATELAATGVATSELIQPVGEGPDGPNAWSADDLRALLLDGTSAEDLIVFAGHFDAGAALAADYASVLFAEEIAAAPTDFTNSLVLGLGCHTGYNVPGPDALPFFSPDPDFAEAFNSRGATYIGSTGYAYGDTELEEYGERLLINLTRALRTGQEQVPIGQALVQAKLNYLAAKTSLSGIDEKTLLQSVLYGLPMLRADLPGASLPGGGASVVGGLTPVAGQPGLGQATIAVNPQLTRTDVPLNDGAVTASYLTGGAGNLTNPAEPIFPLESLNVSVPGRILRGVLFTGGSYTDLANITPLTSAPTTEQSRAHPAFFSDVFYPTQLVAPNFVAATDGGPTRLLVVPAQYRSDEPGSVDGVLRSYGNLQLRLFYLDTADWQNDTDGLRDRALAAAPELVAVDSERLSGGGLAFRVNVLDDAGVGVAEVLVTYSAPGSGLWQSFALSRDGADPTLWRGTVAGGLPEGTRYFVQALNGAGRVSLDNNRGANYLVAPLVPLPPPPPAVATLIEPVAGSFPGSGAFGTGVSFQARLSSAGTPLGGRPLRLSLGGQVVFATTSEAGVASFSLVLRQPPGNYTAQVSFAGASGLRAANLARPFTIVRQGTTLTIAGGEGAVFTGESTGIVATLSSADGQPIPDRTIIFIADPGEGPTLGRAVKTDLDGRAVLSAVPWPAGSYSVRAYFAGTVPGVGTFSDLFYEPSSSGTIGLTLVPKPDRALCYAEGAQSISFFQQGTRKGGGTIPAERSDPTRALGLPQNNDTLNFVALGFDGYLIMAFANPIANDGTSAPDIRVWETSFNDANQPWSNYPEAARVFASNDGESWTQIGTTTDKDQAYDLVLMQARYLAFLDVSDSRRFNDGDDGFDLDAVEVLSGCVPGE